MQCACAILSSVTRPSLQKSFPHYLVNGTIFGKKVIEHKICFLYLLQLLSENFLILRKSERDMIINVH